MNAVERWLAIAVGVSGVQEWSCLAVDYIRFYVDDAEHWRQYYCNIWNFSERSRWQSAHTLDIWLSHARIHILLSQAIAPESPVARYRGHQAQGVAEVGLQVKHLDRAVEHLKRSFDVHWLPGWNEGRARGVRLQTPFGICHTLIERSGLPQLGDGLLPDTHHSNPVRSDLDEEVAFTHIDHVVLNVGCGQLDDAMQWYEQAFGLELLDRFDIQTPYSGLRSVVMGRRDRGLQLPINEPTHPQSQVQEFLDANGGAGIQHVAFHSSDIARSVRGLRERGVEFLSVPPTYYAQLATSPHLRDRVEQLRANRLLADLEPPDRLLVQTFARPLFGEPTFFYEIVQRQRRAIGFGEGNFQALYEAIERDQQQRTGLRR
ncbi:MAG: VOC family protein [Cyanobacteria bacterium P01_D01_bin.123]